MAWGIFNIVLDIDSSSGYEKYMKRYVPLVIQAITSPLPIKRVSGWNGDSILSPFDLGQSQT